MVTLTGRGDNPIYIYIYHKYIALPSSHIKIINNILSFPLPIPDKPAKVSGLAPWRSRGSKHHFLLKISDMIYKGDTVDGSLKSGDHQLRLVVYPSIYRVSYIPGGCLRFQPSTVQNKVSVICFVPRVKRWHWGRVKRWHESNYFAVLSIIHLDSFQKSEKIYGIMEGVWQVIAKKLIYWLST